LRLFVTGPTGSGKSTLADHIARRAIAPLYALDDIHWEPAEGGDRRRDPSARLAMLAQIAGQDDWVIEGVQFKWADQAMERADAILVLDLPRWRNRVRIARRFVDRRLSGEPGPRGTLRALYQEYRWSNDYFDHERAMLFDKLEQWRDKLVVARDSASALSMIEDLQRRRGHVLNA